MTPVIPPTRETVSITALFVALTLGLAYPLSVHPASTVLPMGGDTRLFLWMLEWDVHALTHRPWAVFDANIFAPGRLTLAYSENCLGSALIAAPFLWLTRNPVLAMNAVALISCVLCGVGAYLLARQLGLSKSGSLVAAMVFAFAPPRFLRLGQLHLAPVQWMPFCLLYLDRYFSTGRARDVKIAALFFALQVMTSGHAGVFLILAVVCLVGWRLARRESIRVASLPGDVGVAGVASLLVVVLLMVPYVLVQREQAWLRSLDEARLWSPNLASFLESPSHVHRFVQSALQLPTAGAKAALFPGVVPLILAVVGLWAALRSRDARARLGAFVIIAVVSLWLAAGPDYGLYALASRLPASNLIRVPSRYVTLTLLALAVLAGLGFDRLSHGLRLQRQSSLALAVLLALALEFAVLPLDAVPYEHAIPKADRWLAGRARPFTVAEVPVVDPRSEALANSRQSVYMIHSTAHWQKTVHGYSGYEPPAHSALYRELLAFPDAASLDRLDRFGVDYVVVHESYYGPDEWPAVRQRLVSFSGRLGLVYRDEESRVYALKKRAR